jgi:hypothetical protein
VNAHGHLGSDEAAATARSGKIVQVVQGRRRLMLRLLLMPAVTLLFGHKACTSLPLTLTLLAVVVVYCGTRMSK